MSILKSKDFLFEKSRPPIWLSIIYSTLIFGIITGGYLFYKEQINQLQKNAVSEIQSVGQLKVDQIVQWRSERMGDAFFIMENFAFENTKGLPFTQETFFKKFRDKQILKPYCEILLIDASGKILRSIGDKTTQLSYETLKALKAAFSGHVPVIADLHINKASDDMPRMDIAIPFFNTIKGESSPAGAIILSIDGRQYLYPMLQKWPVPAYTSETLIVRREGDSVLFLNELRHQKNTALKFSLPLTKTSTPAIVAVLGKEGIYKGSDYRGKDVIAMLKKIPDSPWYMVAKVDTNEAFAMANFRQGTIFVITLLLLFAVIVTMAFSWNNRQKYFYKSMYQSELEKKALQKHFEYLVKYANDIIILADANLHIVEVNERAIEEYGYTYAQIKNLNLSDLIDENDYDQFQKMLESLRMEASYIREGMHKRKNGSVFAVEISGRNIEIEGVFFFQGIIRNITERKKIEAELYNAHEELREKYKELKTSEEELSASFEEIQSAEEELAIQNEELRISKERAEESDRLKTAFLQNMSHEIRTPMNAIVGFSKLLEENIHDPLKVKKFSKIITNRSNDLLSIINEILEVSRIETGQINVNEQTCHINHLLDELFLFFESFKHQIGKEHVSLEYKKLPEGNDIVITDMVKFKQIFINLIQNAFKYTLKGHISFGFECQENECLLFFVSDTGVGIPEDKFSEIFDRFMQIDRDTTPHKEGLGLGLSIAKGLVTLLGGKIWVKSELDHGSVFKFTLPAKIAMENENSIAFTNDEYNYYWKGKTFLIVEDDLSDQEYLKKLLENRGVRLIFVATGKEAIDMVMLGAKIDLILMDLMLPDISGLEATKHIKAVKPNIPVIAQTAFAKEIDKEQSFAAGCDGYIAKPIYAMDFFTLVSTHVS